MKTQPIKSPAVWYGQELFDREDWLVELSPSLVGEIHQAVATDASSESFRLPDDLVERLASVQDSLENGSGAVLIRGFDPGDFTVDQLKSLFLSVSSRVGTVLPQSADGTKVFSVRNAGFADDDPRARGPNTKKKLSFHTDRCDVIGFLCVRQAKEGGDNQLVSSAALFNEVLERRPDLLEVLMQPYCYQRHNFDLANELPYTEQPIFSIHEGYFAANFLRVLIDRAHNNPDLPSLSEQQIEALDLLESVAAESKMHVTFRLQPGDIVFMNNWITLHRRTAFEDHESPELRRHILRTWLSMPNSRPVDPMFAGNYGATGAGEIRGGIKLQKP
ncbi:MAG: TauD/TfdA family dioxygenase [Planctomycetota bacterium]